MPNYRLNWVFGMVTAKVSSHSCAYIRRTKNSSAVVLAQIILICCRFLAHESIISTYENNIATVVDSMRVIMT